MHHRRYNAFTLIEILIVVIILAILAAIVVPNFASASRDTREAVLRDELRYVRTQIGIYAASHAYPPGVGSDGSVSAIVFVEQLTKFSDFHGNTSEVRDSQYTFAPYLSQMPRNPFTPGDAQLVKVVTGDGDLTGEIDESTGWVFQPATLRFCANSALYGPGGKNW